MTISAKPADKLSQEANFTRQQEFVAQVLNHSANPKPLLAKKSLGCGKAPVNIALSKYWGKREPVLNLPTNSSLSISLPDLGTETQISLLTAEHQQDAIYLNGEQLSNEVTFAKRLSEFLNHFRSPGIHFKVETVNTVPTAAGLASSASGYAALVLALNDLFDWQLSLEMLSLLARMGSGSASRSLFSGFAMWYQGKADDGMDSYAEPISTIWPEFCIGLLEINVKEKPVSSTAGMQNTVNTCALYEAWPKQANRDVEIIHQAVLNKDFTTLGQTAEHNALSMHATMIATWPPILYWQAESVAAMHKIWQLREQGVEVYFTMDAGPNLKLMFLEKQKPAIEQAFTEMKTLMPFKGL